MSIIKNFGGAKFTVTDAGHAYVEPCDGAGNVVTATLNGVEYRSHAHIYLRGGKWTTVDEKNPWMYSANVYLKRADWKEPSQSAYAKARDFYERAAARFFETEEGKLALVDAEKQAKEAKAQNIRDEISELKKQLAEKELELSALMG